MTPIMDAPYQDRYAAEMADAIFSDSMTVRDVLAKWPATRPVFDRAGLMGCGGTQGPAERLDFFAHVHRVPLEPLKRALHETIRAQAPGARRELAVAPAAPLAHEPVHRYVPFLLSAIALTLTFGATLGMINLARLTTPWFGGMTLSSVRAHAFVQVFGFVGLFVMGIACHVLPRFAARPLGAPRLVQPMLVLQIAGVVAIVGAFMLRDVPIDWAWASGSLALVAANTMFLIVVVRTIAGAEGMERIGPWVIAGTAWLVITAAGAAVAAWQGEVAILQALWPAALWGFAGSWILGIGRRIFPGFLRWQPRAARAERPAFAIYQLGVAASAAAAWPAASEPPRALVATGALALLVSVPLFSWCLGVGSRPRASHDVEGGYQRYVAAGWVWLFVALAVGPLWTLTAALRGAGVPPLVTDFARHALAFGFVTQIMMGVATRVLPVFTGNPLWSPRARTAAFYLLNASVVLRGLEVVVAAGFAPALWPVIAVAGPPALAAVVLFALNVMFTIFGRPAVAPGVPPLPDRRISDLLQIPGALDLLVAAGFAPLKNPIMRATLAGSVTLRQACGMRGVALEPLASRLADLEAGRG
jgi:uncharacterized protein involved in response to NO